MLYAIECKFINALEQWKYCFYIDILHNLTHNNQFEIDNFLHVNNNWKYCFYIDILHNLDTHNN